MRSYVATSRTAERCTEISPGWSVFCDTRGSFAERTHPGGVQGKSSHHLRGANRWIILTGGCARYRSLNHRLISLHRSAVRVVSILLAVFVLAPASVLAQQAAQPKTEPAQKQTEEAKPKTEDSTLTSVPGAKALGMSILGNQEAPKALVIVPWKSSEPGNGPSVTTMLDDSRLPVDKEVFMRMLSYYEIANAAQRRK